MDIEQELLDDIVHLINTEIQWCYQNPMKYHISKDFHEGFIKGLEQAKQLIIRASNEIIYVAE